MDGEGIRNSEGHGLPSTLQATQLSKLNVDSLPESVSTVTKAVLDANPEGRPKKKTVVEMLLEESLCLQNVTKSTLLKFVLTSQILESDRQKYLSNQIPKSKIGFIDIRGSEALLKDPKTLMFFLGSYVQNGEIGTLMAIVESKLAIIYPVFLQREIVKTIVDDKGIFSFQFGPPRTVPRQTPAASEGAESSLQLHSSPTSSEHSARQKYVSTACDKDTSLAEVTTLAHCEVFTSQETPYSDIHIPSRKRAAGAPLEYQSRTTQVRDRRHSIKDLVGLQIALASTTKSILAAERLTRTKMQSLLESRVNQLQLENNELRRTITMLLGQLRAFSVRSEPYTRSNRAVDVRSVAPPFEAPSDFSLNMPAKIPWACRWRDCPYKAHRYHSRAEIIHHVMEMHVKSQSR